jgi:hypothetical protein
MQKLSLKKKVSAIFIAMLCSIPAIGFQSPATDQEQTSHLAGMQLEQQAVSVGNVKVIVKLLVPQINELTSAANKFCSPDPGKETDWGGSQADMALMDSIVNAAQGILLELRGNAYEVKHIYKSIPYMALQVSAEALAILRSLPTVLAIEEDIPLKLIDPVMDNGKAKGSTPPDKNNELDPPLLNNTVNLIGASAAWSMGYTGSGRYVAILDTGIRNTHEFFGGKTIVEACYASGSDGVGPVGDCPNGTISQTGPGTAVHYSSSYSGYDHGTHVAGIAAGNHDTLFGIAKDANIIAVKIFSMFPAASCGGSSPCVMSWSSDQLAGLDYVYSIRGSYSIDAVNMSLGGGAYSSACDSDSRKTVIDNLRAVGIVTAIATGNDGYCGYVGSPACISTSVAVGSSTDADAESGFNNWHATMQSLFAPGSAIYSATGVSDTSYGSWSGTSMATPHVAGAWALIKQAKSSATVTEILSTLQSTGAPITSVCDGYVAPRPRIQINAAIKALLPPGIIVTSPNGGENWNSGTTHDITWTSTGSIANVHIYYSPDNGTNWGVIVANTANDGSFIWTVPADPSPNCLVWIRNAADINPSDVSNRVFSISSAAAETVSIPSQPAGADSGLKDTSYSFSTGGSASNLAHALQYKFDWDDGADSGWLAEGTTSASHSWSSAGTYHVRTMARCSLHATVESLWSDIHNIIISDSGSAGFYNSPVNRLILPEATWAPASGGGDWTSELQLVDSSGGSTVQVYYNTGTNRRGPFTLWTNSSGAAGSSVIFSNIVQTIDGLDSGAFTYYGTGGALELVSQDSSHLLQVAVRSYNGSFSRTFPALADVETNTAATGRSLIIPNLSNDSSYRPSVILFNPSADSVTAEVKIIGSNGAQVGSTISRTLAGYEQNTIVTEVRSNTYSNADILVNVTGGSGRLIASGQTANNASNDPAAHLAVQTASGYANSMGTRLILPETTWAPASGGGDWVSEVHVTDLSGGAVITVYYNTGTSRRGPFTLWTNSGGANCSVTFGNILQTIDGLDGSATTYYGTGGSLELITQDGSHLIQAAVRTYNGNFSRTFPALLDREETTAAGTRMLLIPNICNNATYRPSVVLFNPSVDSVTVEVKIIDSDGAQVGSTINRSLAGYQQNTIVDEVRAFTYDNAKVQIAVTGGSGRVIASGQSANNTSNDPAAHIAVQGQ